MPSSSAFSASCSNSIAVFKHVREGRFRGFLFRHDKVSFNWCLVSLLIGIARRRLAGQGFSSSVNSLLRGQKSVQNHLSLPISYNGKLTNHFSEKENHELSEYFENAKGTGVLATTDMSGQVNQAIYAKPLFLEKKMTGLVPSSWRTV